MVCLFDSKVLRACPVCRGVFMDLYQVDTVRSMVCLCSLAVPCAVMVQCIYMYAMLEDVSSVELMVLVIACCV